MVLQKYSDKTKYPSFDDLKTNYPFFIDQLDKDNEIGQ